MLFITELYCIINRIWSIKSRVFNDAVKQRIENLMLTLCADDVSQIFSARDSSGHTSRENTFNSLVVSELPRRYGFDISFRLS